MPELLLQLTALALSLSLGGGSGVFGVREIVPPASGEVQPVAQVAPGKVQAFDRGAPKPAPVNPSIPSKTLATAALAQLSELDSRSLASFVQDHPDALAKLLAAPIAPSAVAGWWASLSIEAQRKLIKATPQLVGNLDGVPFEVRGRANDAYLNRTIDELETKLHSGVGRGMNVKITNHVEMLTQIRDALRVKPGEPRRTLVGLDTVAPGRAAIVVGDVETADYVSYLIPGMFFTIDGQIDDWTDIATTLYHDQLAWLGRLGKSSQTVATVAWIGYQTPQLLNVGSLQLADEGADYLSRAISGLKQVRQGSEPYISIMAHSYGSTAALIALQHGGIEVDALAVVGSPGSAAQHVSDLAVRNGNVFVGEAGWDPVVNSAFYGSDPGAATYGAHRMSVVGGIDVITRKRLDPSYGHNEYFRAGSESMRNFALIGIDEGGLVMNNDGVLIAAEQRH